MVEQQQVMGVDGMDGRAWWLQESDDGCVADVRGIVVLGACVWVSSSAAGGSRQRHLAMCGWQAGCGRRPVHVGVWAGTGMGGV